MTGLQLAILSGAVFATGLVVIAGRLVPAPPRLLDVVARLRPVAIEVSAPRQTDTESRLGSWAERHLPGFIWGTPPDRDLRILERSRASYYGSKLITASLGLLIGPLLGLFAVMMGIEVPLLMPVAGSLGLAVVMWFMPNAELADKARTARLEFSYALGAYVEMVALERLGGSTVPAALQRAAEVGDSWPFERIGITLRRTQYTGRSPWDALADLGRELALPDLVDLADIMRLAGADGTQVYDSLRARARAMRHQLLSAQVSRANSASERIAVPVGLLVFVLAMILITPAFLRLM